MKVTPTGEGEAPLDAYERTRRLLFPNPITFWQPGMTYPPAASAPAQIPSVVPHAPTVDVKARYYDGITTRELARQTQSLPTTIIASRAPPPLLDSSFVFPPLQPPTLPFAPSGETWFIPSLRQVEVLGMRRPGDFTGSGGGSGSGGVGRGGSGGGRGGYPHGSGRRPEGGEGQRDGGHITFQDSTVPDYSDFRVAEARAEALLLRHQRETTGPAHKQMEWRLFYARQDRNTAPTY